MRRFFVLTAALIFLLTSVRLFAQDIPPATCGGEPQQGCPCGKMPVCVVSDHENGFFSMTLFDSAEHSTWEGFGQGNSDFGAAMYAEILMANALAAIPCIEPVILNSYHAGTLLVADEAEQSGLTKAIQDAIAAGDEEKLKELQAQLDKLFEKYGLGDMPWRDPKLAGEQLQHRPLSCATGMVGISGKMDNGKFTMSAEVSSPMAQSGDQAFSSTSDSPNGGMGELAQQAAKAVIAIQQKLFCSCQTVLERCNVTNFELSNQESECIKVKTCCSEPVQEEPETTKVKGLSFGETRKYEQVCCSAMARARAGEKIGGLEVEGDDLKTMDEIWCPGTWNLRGPDLDCDGIPNAKDDTPRPAGEN